MKVIYTPLGQAGEYTTKAANLFAGQCLMNCTYCYNSYIHRSHEQLLIKPHILHDLQQDLEEFNALGTDEEILFSFVGDLYQDDPDVQKLTSSVIHLLVDYDVKFTILTKGGTRIYKDLPLLRKTNKFRLGVSLVWSDDAIRQMWEPNATSVSDRLDSIRYMKDEGFPVWISLEPVIDCNQALGVIYKLRNTGIDHWKVGKLNHLPECEERIDWNAVFSSLAEALKGENVLWKKSWPTLGGT